MSRSRNMPLLVPALLAVVLVAQPGRAQGPPPNQPDLTIDAAARGEVIDSLIKSLDKEYVFPETARKMADDLRSRIGESRSRLREKAMAATPESEEDEEAEAGHGEGEGSPGSAPERDA